MAATLKVTLEKDELVIRLPVNSPPAVSGTGKSLVVASTHGNVRTECLVDGKPLSVGVNAYIGIGR